MGDEGGLVEQRNVNGSVYRLREPVCKVARKLDANDMAIKRSKAVKGRTVSNPPTPLIDGNKGNVHLQRLDRAPSLKRCAQNHQEGQPLLHTSQVHDAVIAELRSRSPASACRDARDSPQIPYGSS